MSNYVRNWSYFKFGKLKKFKPNKHKTADQINTRESIAPTTQFVFNLEGKFDISWIQNFTNRNCIINVICLPWSGWNLWSQEIRTYKNGIESSSSKCLKTMNYTKTVKWSHPILKYLTAKTNSFSSGILQLWNRIPLRGK